MNGISLGFLTGLLGSILVIIPTFETVKLIINNQDKIKELEAARHKLTKEGDLFANDPGFNSVREIIEKNWDQQLTPECRGFHRPKLIYEDTEGEETYHRIMTTYSVNSDAIESDHPSAENCLQDIESLLIIDSWIEDKIRMLKTNRVQRVRGVGLFLIVISSFI